MTNAKLINAMAAVINEAMKTRQTAAGIALAIVNSQVWAGRLAPTVPDTNWGESTKDVPLAVTERAAISEEVNDDSTPADRVRYFCRVLLADSGHRRNDTDRLAAALAEANRAIDRAREDAAYWRRRYREESCTAWDDGQPPGGEVCAAADCGRPVESEPCPEHNPRTVAEQLRARITELVELLDQAHAEARTARPEDDADGHLRARVAELESAIRQAMTQMGVAPESYKGTASSELHAAYDRLRAVLREGTAGSAA
ncbi:hypothetical protein AB0B79_31540 [Streptomyces sp. NPDC039022]|uniref:hypothetical protein n=1 Tax=Streptomyces sp. NPDC039022 TaxID=3157091 RepID=UPI0033EE716D